MLILAAFALSASLAAVAAEQAPQTPTPADFISKEEHEAVLKESIARNAVDTPIKAT